MIVENDIVQATSTATIVTSTLLHSTWQRGHQT